MNYTKLSLLLFLSLTILISCDPPQDKSKVSPAEVIKTVEVEKQRQDSLLYWVKRAGIEDGLVILDDLNAAEKCFPDHFSLSVDGKTKIPKPNYVFKRESLELALANYTCHDGGVAPIVVLHYGMDKQGQLIYGIGLTCAELNSKRTFKDPDVILMPNDNKELKAYTGGANAWLDEYAKRYQDTVFVRQNGTNSMPWKYGKDVRYSVSSALRISTFLDENSKYNYVSIVPVGDYEKEGGIKHWFHSNCWLPHDGLKSVVTNTLNGTSFEKALDLGSPCPHNCNKFNEKIRGIKNPVCL